MADGTRFLDSYLPFLLHRSYQLLSGRFHASLADMGLDVTECRIMTSLADFGPCSLQQLQSLANVLQPTASRACARLERRGLLRRSIGTGDRRQRIFGLTEDGRVVSRRLMEVSEAALAETLDRTAVDPRALHVMLERLISDLEPGGPSCEPNGEQPITQTSRTTRTAQPERTERPTEATQR